MSTVRLKMYLGTIFLKKVAFNNTALTRLSVGRNLKLHDALDLVSDQSPPPPCSTSALREACLA